MNEQLRTYLFSYQHEGASWVLELKASSPEDAQRRIRQLAWATLDGEVIAKIPVAPSWFLTAANAIRRFLAQTMSYRVK
jgi:hypothetical protein